LLVSPTLYPDEYPALCRRILNGVIQQIDDGLAENQPVNGDEDVRVPLDINPLALLLSQNIDYRTGFPSEAKKRNLFPLKVNVPSVGAGKRQQALREPSEAIYLFQHASDHISILRWTPLVL
jgi:hypothetical protein